MSHSVNASLMVSVQITGKDLRRGTPFGASTAEIQGEELEQACRWLALRFQHTAAVRARLAATYKPATANRMICALRGTLKMAWKLGQMSAEDYHRAADIPAVRGETVPAGRELHVGEISALIMACQKDATPAGARDVAIVSLMYSTGLRREEVVALDRQDYDLNSGRLLIRGKGNKERTAYPEEGASEALADRLAIRGYDPGPIFLPINKAGKLIRQVSKLTAG